MKKLVISILSLFLFSISLHAESEYMTFTVNSMNRTMYISMSNGNVEAKKLVKDDFGSPSSAELPALRKLQELSKEGWELVEVELSTTGHVYYLKRDL